MSRHECAPMIATVLLALVPAARAQDAGTGIAWSADLSTAFAGAKEQQKILMICVNAKYVSGRKTEEPANKGLREVVYKDERVVAATRDFVCAIITPASGSTEFGELRLLGIQGDLVAPQHIFVHPDGKRILLRKQYWSHGKGEPAVKALLALMTEAQQKLAGAGDQPDEAKEPEGAPAGGEERAAWIRERIREVVEGTQVERTQAVAALVRSDKARDCTTPLLALLPENEKNVELLVAVIRGFGRDRLFVASLPIAGFLDHKEEAVRGNAAVSLEYIGDREPKVIAALKKAATREKVEEIANHMYRALGRCGVDDGKVRALLLKKCDGAKTEFASYGPAIGLAYFERDPKAARGMEKLLRKIGTPGGGRGGGQNTVKRGVCAWTLAEIGDPKSAEFIREQFLARFENVQAFWARPLKAFYGNVAKACEGDDEARRAVPAGIRGFVGFAKGADPDRYDREARSMMDDYRIGRDDAAFTPKGDGLLGGG